MMPNPFRQPEAPAWLAEDPVYRIPRLLEHLLEVAGYVPQVYEILPWLQGMDAWGLIQERMSHACFPDASPSAQEATLITFFAQVTQPMAELIETLYVSPLLRRVATVEEIVRRMAHSVGACALPFEVVTGVCCSFGRRRASLLSGDPVQRQTATWRIGWQQTNARVRTAHSTTTPFLLLVIDEPTDKVLAFRSTHKLPGDADVLFALYDALVFSRQDRWHLYPPARVRVQEPVPPEVMRAAEAWGIEVEAVAQHEFAFVQH
jgi:hypothetical protein